MDQLFAEYFQRVRRRVLLIDFIFLVAGVSLAADVYYLSKASPPGFFATYGFAVLFGVILGAHPVLAYVLTRCVRRWNIGSCPLCHRPIWSNSIVATQTALLQRCPHCFESLRWRQGIPVRLA